MSMFFYKFFNKVSIKFSFKDWGSITLSSIILKIIPHSSTKGLRLFTPPKHSLTPSNILLTNSIKFTLLSSNYL